MAERVAVELNEDGVVANLVVLPEDDADLGEAWADRLGRLRVLSQAERRQGIGLGWRRSANGRFVDGRPQREAALQRAADTPAAARTGDTPGA